MAEIEKGWDVFPITNLSNFLSHFSGALFVIFGIVFPGDHHPHCQFRSISGEFSSLSLFLVIITIVLIIMYQSSKESFSLPVKGIITSSLPSTLVDMDTGEVKQTCPFNEHTVIRREFIDIELALLLEEAEDAPVFPAL